MKETIAVLPTSARSQSLETAGLVEFQRRAKTSREREGVSQEDTKGPLQSPDNTSCTVRSTQKLEGVQTPISWITLRGLAAPRELGPETLPCSGVRGAG